MGTLLKHSFLKTIATIFIGANAVIASYSLIDMNYEFLPPEAYGVLYEVALGVITLFFSCALYTLKGIGDLPCYLELFIRS